MVDDLLTRTGKGMRGKSIRGLYSDGSFRTTYTGGPAMHTLLVGHSIFAIVIGLMGGWMGRVVYDRQAIRVTRDV
jgi:hypothetical protein